MYIIFILSLINIYIRLIKEDLNKPIESTNSKKQYDKTHKLKNGKIIIENNKLYEEDIMKHDISKVREWVKKGKYNLTKEELKRQNELYAKNMHDLHGIDYKYLKNT